MVATLQTNKLCCRQYFFLEENRTKPIAKNKIEIDHVFRDALENPPSDLCPIGAQSLRRLKTWSLLRQV